MTQMFLAVAGSLALLGPALQAAPFVYSAGDLLFGVNSAGSSSDFVANLGPASDYYNAGSTFTITEYDPATLISAMGGSLSSINWSVTAASPGGDIPLNSLWMTRARTDIDVQSTPWTRRSSINQGSVASRINGFGEAGVSWSSVNAEGPNNTATSVAMPDTFVNGYSLAIGSGNLGGTFQGNIQNTTPVSFSSVRSDLWELRPGTGTTLPGTYRGYFELNSSGAMTFTPVPEPGTWALLGLGCVALLGARKLRGLAGRLS
jgi:hypothetical protein